MQDSRGIEIVNFTISLALSAGPLLPLLDPRIQNFGFGVANLVSVSISKFRQLSTVSVSMALKTDTKILDLSQSQSCEFGLGSGLCSRLGEMKGCVTSS